MMGLMKEIKLFKSLQYQMLEVQKNQSVKGECSKLLDEFQINIGHESIKMMSRHGLKDSQKISLTKEHFMS